MRNALIGLVIGVYLNAFGWLGNQLWLGPEWDQAAGLVASRVVLPYPPLIRELVSLVFDFVYAVTLVWLFARLRRQTPTDAAAFVAVFGLATVAVTYAAIANSHYLPWELALKAILLAFVLLAPLTWALPRFVHPVGNLSPNLTAM